VLYGDVVLDQAGLDFLTSSLHTLEDPVERGSALIQLWENMLEGRVAPARVIDALLVALPVESDELTVSQMLGYLREGLARASSTSMRASWFNTIRSVATLPGTIAWLEQLWRRETRVDGLPFSEPDEAELALDLAVRDVPDADAILAEQTARFTNPDRKARFIFVTPAVSRDPNVRRQFFESLKDVKNRAHEAWVLEGLRYLHHPLRADTSDALVVPGLSLVLEVHRTGDIFFPKRWADATLGGSQTPAVASGVRAFIDGLPADYPPRLRWVLLASADPLFRAADALR
jgi:aminopeptidase N